MPMNYFIGQIVTPTYTDPIMSIPGSANISRTNEIVQYTPPEISRNSVLHTGPISDEMFDRRAVLAKPAEAGRTDFPVRSDRFLSAGQTGPTGHIVLN